MALDALLAALAADADHAVEEVLTAARARAARMRAEADAAVERRSAEVLASHVTAIRASAEKDRASARRAAARRVVTAREACLRRIFDAATDALDHALDDPAQMRVLDNLVAEALDFLPGLPVVIRCRARHADRIRARAASDGVTVVPDDSMDAGVVVEAADGSVVIDNTVTARLQRLQPRLSIELLQRIGEVT